MITLSPFGDNGERHPLPAPRSRRVDASLVYVSFGSEIREPELFRATADALQDVPKRVLMTIGRHVDPEALGPLPANVRVERWVDQGEVMPHTAAMVGHGGSGGTLAALAAGVPIAFRPQFVDGPANAGGSRRSARGSSRPICEGCPTSCSHDPSYRAAAERVGGRDPRAAAGRGCGRAVQS